MFLYFLKRLVSVYTHFPLPPESTFIVFNITPQSAFPLSSLKTSSVLLRLLPLTPPPYPVLPNLQYLFCSLPRLVTTGWFCSLYKSTPPQRFCTLALGRKGSRSRKAASPTSLGQVSGREESVFTGIYAGESQAWPDPSCRNQKVQELQLPFAVVDRTGTSPFSRLHS